MISPVVFPPATIVSPIAPKQEATASGFAALLTNTKQAMLPQDELSSTSSSLPVLPAYPTELYNELQQLFDSIPIDEGYARQETLNDPIVGQLLQRLPTALKEQVTEVFVPGRSVEQMVEDEKALENNGTLLAVALMLFQLEQRQLPLPSDALEGLQQRLATVFPVNETVVPSHVGDRNVRALLDKLSRSLQVQNQAAALLSNDFSKGIFHIRPSLEQQIPQTEQLKQETQLSHEAVAPTLINNEELANSEEELATALVGGKVLSEHTISLPSNAAKSDVQRSFVYQLTEIMKTGKFTKGPNGQSQLVIRLHPEHLGTLTIKLIAQKDGELAAKIVTNTTAAKELVEASIHQIRHIIPTENIVVERFDVWTQQEFDGMNRHPQQHQSKQPFEHEKQAEKSERAAEEFADALQEELNTTI